MKLHPATARLIDTLKGKPSKDEARLLADTIKEIDNDPLLRKLVHINARNITQHQLNAMIRIITVCGYNVTKKNDE